MDLRQWFALPALVLLACQSVAAVKYSNASTSDHSTTIIHVTSTRFITEFTSSQPVVTVPATSMEGPQILDAGWLEYISYYWTQKYNATTVGTVQIIVNEATNKTITTTKYHTELQSNGTGTNKVAILSRTDVNAAGTVTQVVRDYFNSSTTITFPTPYVHYTDEMSFYGTRATSISGQGSCCLNDWFSSSTPTHAPFPSPKFTTDSADPSGWLYAAFTGFDNTIPLDWAASTDIVSLFGSQVQFTLPQCPYKSCSIPAETSVAAASWAVQQVGIFATETITLSIPDSSSSPTATASSAAGSTSIDVQSTSTSLSSRLPSDAATPSSELKSVSTAAEQLSISVAVPNSLSKNSALSESQTIPDLPSRSSQSPSFSFSPETTSIPAPPAIVIGGSTITQQSNSAFVVGSQTLLPGSSVVIGSGSSTTVVAIETHSGGSAVVVIGSSSSLLQPQVTAATGEPLSQPPRIVVGGSTIAQQSDSVFIVGSQTLMPGGSVTIGFGSSATVVALASNGNSIVFQDGSSSQVEPVVTPTAVVVLSTPAPTIVLQGSTITAQSGSDFVISGQTLKPGSSITVGSDVVGLQSDGLSLILQVGTSTEVVTIPSAVALTTAPPVIIESGSSFIVSGQVLTPGKSITFGTGSSAEAIALQTTGSNVIIVYGDTLSSTLYQAGATSATLPAFTFQGTIISANSASAYIVDGQTLLPGSGVVISGTPISLASGASELIIGTGTADLEVSSTSGGLGGLIWSALDAETTTSASQTASSASSASSSSSIGSSGVTASNTGLPTSRSSGTSAAPTSPSCRLEIPSWLMAGCLALLLIVGDH